MRRFKITRRTPVSRDIPKVERFFGIQTIGKSHDATVAEALQWNSDGSMHLIAGTYTNAPHPDKDKIQEMTQVETFSKSVFSSQAFLELSTTALTARSVHAEHSPNAAVPTRRPRAFGRTSNVWQYVETIQERLTPLSRQKGSASAGDQLRRTSLDFAEGDEDEDAEYEQKREFRGDHRISVSTSQYGESDGGNDGSESLPKRKLSKAAAQHGTRYKRSSKAGMKNVSSLPELLPSSSNAAESATTMKSSGNSSQGIAGNKRSAYPGPGLAPNLSPNARRGIGSSSGFNSAEIIKRIQALGSSASMPQIPTAVSSAGATASGNYPTIGSTPAAVGAGDTKYANGAQQPNTQGAQPPNSALSTVPSVPVPTPAPGAALSDAEKLRNDFNSQRSKLYYGCSVAFELFNGHLMMVGSPDGQVRVQSLEKLQIPQIKGCKDRAIFTLIDLTDVRSANTICYGDAVWLQLSIGTGEVSWEQGGVLGAKVREAPQLKALAISNNGSIRDNIQAPTVVGHPVPVNAYLPKVREDGDTQADEIQSRVRNKASKMVGKWIIRSAVMGPRRRKDVRDPAFVLSFAVELIRCLIFGSVEQNFVYNNDEIYLEQDWFYLGADSDAGIAVLRQLPPSSSLKDVKDGDYVIERRAAWRIRLLDSTNGGSGLSLAQQQMERLLFRAKMQLKQSKKMRAGQTKTYASDLQGGSGFTSQLRSKIAESTRECDERHMERQDRRLDRLAGHFSGKAESMNRALPESDGDMEFPTDFNSQAVEANSEQSTHPSPSQKAVMKGENLSKSQTDNNGSHRVPTFSTFDEPYESDKHGHVCALCQSSTIGYNLCSQIHSVMHAIESESESEANGRLVSQRCALQSASGTSNGKSKSQSPQSSTRSSLDTAGSSAEADGSCAVPGNDAGNNCFPGTSVSSGNALEDSNGAASGFALGYSSSRKQSRIRDVSTVQQQQNQERDRILRLFAVQDEHMLDVIKFKERTVQEALVAKEHARMGLSPLATHFRDRFKHVGLLAQAHMGDYHGIGGHFQKIHDELFSNETHRGGRKPYSQVEQLAQEQGVADFTFDPRTCPIEYPGEGFDVFGNPIDQEAPDPVQRIRLFPSEHEMELIAPVDTKAMMEVYLQNRAAVSEMLDGYVELCETQMIPNLHRAMENYDRGSLVEMLEFTARASEFVCARRIQIQVAKLMHEISDSEVGDFDAFEATFETMMKEFDGTIAFIRFYQKNLTAKKKRK